MVNNKNNNNKNNNNNNNSNKINKLISKIFRNIKIKVKSANKPRLELIPVSVALSN